MPKQKKSFVLKQATIEKLQYCKSLIDEHAQQLKFDEKITHRLLCRKTGLNEYYLKAGFKKMFGCTPIRYFVILKMKHGQKLLRETSISVEDIASTLNYHTSGNFAREFRKYAGCRPGEYRRGGA